jgi:N utilization substance protein B
MAKLNFLEEDPLAADPNLPDNRHGARQLALQALYWAAAASDKATTAVDQLALQSKLSASTHDFATQLVVLVEDRNAELRELIVQTASNWREERISRIDGIILRLALAEILFREDIPARVSIHQAVELAKAYSGEKSYAFVNGILDTIVRQKDIDL